MFDQFAVCLFNDMCVFGMQANHYPGEHTEVAFPHQLYSKASVASVSHPHLA